MIKTLLICSIMGCSNNDTIPTSTSVELLKFRSEQIHNNLMLKDSLYKDSLCITQHKIDSLKIIRDSLLIEIKKLK